VTGAFAKIAARLRRPKPRRFRVERWGGIVQLSNPAALVFVDRERARSLGHDGGALWQAHAEEFPGAAPLSAPLEAHLQLTNRCDAGCSGCYTSATPKGLPAELGLDGWKRSIDELAEAGVFHLALGGGESATLPWLGEIVEHARSRGLVPNLTTSGLYDDATLARLVALAPRFGQINVSLDGVGATYEKVRGIDGFGRADRALVALRKANPDVGINTVLTRESVEDLPALFSHARRRGVSQVELLRYKPSGRGRREYEAQRMDAAQAERLLPTVLRLSLRHRLRVRLDCSLVPFIAHHRPSPRLLRWLSIYGCAGGDHLVGAKADGSLTPCSFAPVVDAKVEGLRAYTARDDAFGVFRRWADAKAPCSTCEYLSLCRGGCRVVSLHTTGRLDAPDPECPRVRAHAAIHPAPTHRLRVLS
jgi:radical SAM protein with 4Fe4S-binding SPASM domain